MKASFHILISTLLCLSLATAGPIAQAEPLPQRSEVRARLIEAGVDATSAEARVAALTDEEVTLLATKFDELPAGGRGDGLVALVLIALAVVVIVEFWPFFLVGGVAMVAINAQK